MLPEWETDISRQRGRQANLNQDYLNRTPHEEDFAKDKSFHDVEEPQALNKSFLPGISNSRQADNFRTISQNTYEKRHYHSKNRSVFDRPTITDEKKIMAIPSHSRNNSIERPPPRKHFDDSVSDEFDYREEYPEQNETLFTPAKVDQQQQRILPQHLSNRNNEDSFQKIVAEVSLHDKKNAQKAYGQFLLDQIKANASRRTIEREQRKEEDRQLLNQQGFLDGFGRSRDKFLNKYRSKLYQAPPIHRENNKKVSPIAFDKVNNYERNYNLYPSSHGAMDHSFNQNQNAYSLRGNRNYMEEKENQQAVNRTMQPYYNNDLIYPSEENETEQAEDFAEKNLGGIQKNQNKVANNLPSLTSKPFYRRLLNFLNQLRIKNQRIITKKTLKCHLLEV